MRRSESVSSVCDWLRGFKVGGADGFGESSDFSSKVVIALGFSWCIGREKEKFTNTGLCMFRGELSQGVSSVRLAQSEDGVGVEGREGVHEGVLH
ncbi:hypothetical protein TNCV_1791011 [Trichonephila clavipes]|nr:hypothetical protein TNCV_1791011 [Trichonephila clavipes]